VGSLDNKEFSCTVVTYPCIMCGMPLFVSSACVLCLFSANVICLQRPHQESTSALAFRPSARGGSSRQLPPFLSGVAQIASRSHLFFPVFSCSSPSPILQFPVLSSRASDKSVTMNPEW